MPEASRCWVCHRSLEEITAAVDTETQEERELKKQMSQVSWTRSKFVETADLWRKTLPRDFKDMDFQFIASNASQFGTIKGLSEVLDAKRLMADWLADASSRLRKGEEGMRALPELAPLEKADADSLVKMLDQFEARSRRTIQSDTHKEGYVPGFEGLKLFDGLEFLIAQGILYYDVRTQLLTFAMVRANAKKPKTTLRMIQANGYPPVQLCSVCETLMVGLRAPERKVEIPAAAPEGAEKPSVAVEKPAEGVVEPEKVAVAVPVVAVVDGSEGLSPRVAEIVNQLGPATKEAPKTRGLHEHRAKEEWDEVLQRQANEK
ncbi:MAG TPA: hypothetical protein VEH01_02095 [Nitrososphaerales archaeon]|nr:hypothetical protein [Nitrososphaerales archaeon]